MSGTVSYLNPDTLHKNPAFSQVVVTSGNVRTIYIGGQNAVNSAGNIVGKGDLKVQTEQVFRNLIAALAAVDAHLGHVIKWNIHILHGQSIRPALEVFKRVWGERPNPPLITIVFVTGLADPDFLLEIDAIAAIPQG